MKGAVLWQRILREGLRPSDFDTMDPTVIRNSIIAAPIIVDGRSAEEADSGSLRWDFAGLALPFTEFWYEYPCGAKAGHPHHVGILILSDAQTKDLLHEDDRQTLERLGSDRVVMAVTCICGAGVRPMLGSTAFFAMREDGSCVCNKDGNLVTFTGDTFLSNTTPSHHNSIIFTPLTCLFEGLEMLSCRNVSLSHRLIPKRDADYATRRHGPIPGGYRYHVLVVRPPGAKSDSPGVEIGNMPRHVCRGHFAEYGPKFGKGLLFGRLEGRFYIPPHMRGDAKHGVVDKDYQISPRAHS